MTGLAWLGGAAFAASLLYLGYFYTIVLGRPGADGSALVANLTINTAMFAAFALHHSLLARPRVKARLIRVVDPRLERTLYVWTASLLLVLVCAAWRPLPGIVYDAGGGVRVLLFAVQAAGALLTLRGASVIDPLDLAGIRQASAPRAASPDARTTSALQIRGPFRVVRHPIYLGWMLMVFGAPLMTTNRLWFALITSAYLILAIPWEERSLAAAHGDRYRAYQQQVRWRLVPRLW